MGVEGVGLEERSLVLLPGPGILEAGRGQPRPSVIPRAVLRECQALGVALRVTETSTRFRGPERSRVGAREVT